MTCRNSAFAFNGTHALDVELAEVGSLLLMLLAKQTGATVEKQLDQGFHTAQLDDV